VRVALRRLAEQGALELVASVPTKEGARNGVVDEAGRVYLAHSRGGELVVATPAK